MAAVSKVLRDQDFDTVLGRIGFDEKGDVTGYEPFSGTSGRATLMSRPTRASSPSKVASKSESKA
jgi:hypothetical protein